MTPGLFVTGTDTGVGKSVLSAALCARLRAEGRRVAAAKPLLTGMDEVVEPEGPRPGGEAAAGGSGGGAAAPEGSRSGGEAAASPWPPDHELLAAATGQRPEDVAPLRFGPAVSPHLAAELAGCRIDAEPLIALARDAVAGADVAIVEGVGGLLVPISDDYAVRDLARDLGLPLIVAARPGLGTINHTLLTLEAARAAGLDVRAVVLTPWPDDPTAIERSNRDTIARLGGVEVATLPHVPAPEPRALAAAARDLPVQRWLGAGDGAP